MDRFGAQAIFGRALSASEVKGMILADNVVNAYNEKHKSTDWTVWESENPERARLLNEAMVLWQKQQ